MVCNQHEIASRKVLVDATGRICQEKRPDAPAVHHAYREGRFVGSVAFVQVDLGTRKGLKLTAPVLQTT